MMYHTCLTVLKQEHGSAKTCEHNLLDGRYVADRHRCHMDAKFGVFVDENHDRLYTLYCKPQLNKKKHMNHILFLILGPELLLNFFLFYWPAQLGVT